MGIHLRLVNFDNMIRNSGHDTVIINDLPDITEENKEAIEALITVKYVKTDVFGNIPKCPCGETSGKYLLGVKCENCMKPVREIFDEPLVPLVWFRRPKGVAKLINPRVWLILSKAFTKKGFNIIEWLCTTSYRPTGNRPKEVDELIAMKIPRGYNNFVNNFDYILNALFKLEHFRVRKGSVNKLLLLLDRHRDCVFSDYIPFVNKTMLIVEDTKTDVYVDPLTISIMDVVHTVSGIDTEMGQLLSVHQKENKTVKALSMVAAYNNDVDYYVLSRKSGLARKGIFSNRNNFAVRSVISSITKPHRHDEIELGWGPGLTVLAFHVTNKLMNNLDYTPNQCAALTQDGTYTYTKLMDDLMKEVIAESPDKKLYSTTGRNPSLTKASAQALGIPRIKTDPLDATTGLPITNTKRFNADFDGDQMYTVLAMDNYTSRGIKELAPHKTALSVNAPRRISKNSSFPKPVATTAANLYHAPVDMNIPPHKLAFMMSLAV